MSSTRQLADELDGAKATIAHMSEAMSWISGHDRQGLDHLEEMLQASAERDAAEAKLRQIQELVGREPTTSLANRILAVIAPD